MERLKTMAYNIARKGSDGNARLLKQYGGSDKGDRQKYADGGSVKAGGNPSLAEGLSASGAPAKPSLARPGRKAPGKGGKKDAKTNVNVLIMPKPDAAPAGAGAKPEPMPTGPAIPAPMPMPPPGVGGPPMPMRANGGRVGRAAGGPAGMRGDDEDDSIVHEARGGIRSIPKASKVVPKVAPKAAPNAPGGAVEVLDEAFNGPLRRVLPGNGGGILGSNSPFSSGRKKQDKNPYAVEDDTPRDKRSVGGPAKPPKGFGAGAGSGKGRIEKAKKYGD